MMSTENTTATNAIIRRIKWEKTKRINLVNYRRTTRDRIINSRSPNPQNEEAKAEHKR
jgi:hypothetical protein